MKNGKIQHKHHINIKTYINITNIKEYNTQNMKNKTI